MKKSLTIFLMFCFPHVFAHAETIQFNKNNSITMDIPENWEREQQPGGTALPEMGITFDLKLTSPLSQKASLTITTGKSQTGKPLTKKQFDSLTKNITEVYFRRSVEKKAEFVELSVGGGQGKYSIFTDPSFVSRTPGPDDYKYYVLFLINYDNGCFVYATGFVNDVFGVGFQNIVKSVSSIVPSLAEIVPTPRVQIRKNKQEILIGNAVSSIKLRIPPGNFKEVKERMGGGQNSPGYFIFTDSKTNLSLSGWMETADKFRYDNVSELWDAAQSAAQSAGVKFLNPEFTQIGEWEVFLYDMPVPKVFGNVANAHIQANLLLENAWINLHISRTDEKPNAILRDELVDYLKTIQILK
jgi:hypothetical protein